MLRQGLQSHRGLPRLTAFAACERRAHTPRPFLPAAKLTKMIPAYAVYDFMT
jgi:hypothetical protein